MTVRLEAAIRQLSPEEVERLTRLAERLVEDRSATSAKPGDPPKLEWIGCLADAPEKDGVEAARRAIEIRLELLEKSRPK